LCIGGGIIIGSLSALPEPYHDARGGIGFIFIGGGIIVWPFFDPDMVSGGNTNLGIGFVIGGGGICPFFDPGNPE
jgi:hypothetical protein